MIGEKAVVKRRGFEEEEIAEEGHCRATARGSYLRRGGGRISVSKGNHFDSCGLGQAQNKVRRKHSPLSFSNALKRREDSFKPSKRGISLPIIYCMKSIPRQHQISPPS